MSDIIRLRNGDRIRVDEFPAGYLDGLNGRLDALSDLHITDQLQRLDFESQCGVRISDAIKILWFVIPLSNPHDCGEVATAVMTCTNCAYVALVCTHHQDEIYSYVSVICSFCGVKASPAGLVRFSPIPDAA